MGEVVDGEFQKYSVMPGGFIRKHFFGADPRLESLVADMTDEQNPAVEARRSRPAERSTRPTRRPSRPRAPRR